MHIAMRRADEARRELGSELDVALEAAGLPVLVRPLAGRLRELYFGDFVVLSDRLPENERRELSAHALSHHLLHAGNQWHQQGRTYSRANYQERQADVFAAFFLVPEHELGVAADEPQFVAERFGITEAFAQFRLRLQQARTEALR